MASYKDSHPIFRYSSLQIFKDESIGNGAYGAVYKAKCDQLPCAAKVLHQTIVDPRDVGADKIMKRFLQECSFLERIRHPHIVQYLGVSKDPESRLPVLLMELLDESLTKMLERSQQPLAFHVEVDICHDVALAVAYLHSNDVIHRDLSSNNVLIIAGRRAKVTDFGMSKLANVAPSFTPLTMCPGTVAYMPPEALREPPRYTKKLDCFSEGVLMIQVCTRLLPDPGPRTQLVPDTRSPTGAIEMPVLENERRESHIDLIDSTHPLLSIAMDCLSYQEEQRPTSEELCLSLGGLVDSDIYRQSAARQQDNQSSQEISALKEKVKRLSVEDEANKKLIQRQNDEIERNKRELVEKDKLLHQKENQLQQAIESHDEQMLVVNHDLNQLVRSNHSLKKEVSRLQQLLEQEKPSAVQRRASNPLPPPPPVRQVHPDEIMAGKHSSEEHVYCSLIPGRILEEKPLPPTPSLLPARSLEEKPLPPKPSLFSSRSLEEKSKPSLLPARSHEEKPPPPKPRNLPHRRSQPPLPDKTQISLEWRNVGKAPLIMERGDSVVSGNVAYFVSVRGEACSYNVHTRKWSMLPKCPYAYCSLAVVYGHLTAIGGCTLDNFDPQNKLMSIMSDRGWVAYFPHMPTKRWKSVAVSTPNHLIVAGGKNDTTTLLNIVEVLDIPSMEWFAVASLPHPYSEASATICGDRLYILGGFNSMGKTKSVLACSLTELLQRKRRSAKWHNVEDIPAMRSTCAAVKGELFAFGGLDANNRKTADVYMYSLMTNTWDMVSSMPTAQYDRLVAVLSTNEIMAVGGCTRFKTDNVDIATIS